MNSTIRAFIAIELAQGTLARIEKALRPLKNAYPKVKWVDRDNFHITLKFLGPNVPTTELHRIIQGVEQACAQFEQFDVVLEGLGAFPDARNPRTLWVGVREGTEELTELASKIEEALQPLGFQAENRAFSPHLTVGRTRQAERGAQCGEMLQMLQERAELDFGVSPADQVVLFASELTRGGPKYEALATFPLAPIGADLQAQYGGGEQDSKERIRAKERAKEASEKPAPNMRVKFDVRALDEQVDQELREICGDAFSRRRPKKK